MILANANVDSDPKKDQKRNSIRAMTGEPILLRSMVLTDSRRQEKAEGTGDANALVNQCTQTNFMVDYDSQLNVNDSEGAGMVQVKYDIVLIEIGGTVGDIESQPFLEAQTQMIMELGKENCLSLHLTLVPLLPGAGELKTKPTQHSAKELRACGIQPDAIICRSANQLPDSIKRKISLFTHVHQSAVFSCYNADSVYLVPLILRAQNLDEFVLRALQLELTEIHLEKWIWLKNNYVEMKAKTAEKTIICGIVGKYFDN